MKMPSTMRGGGRFAKVPQATIQRSQFNRSHGHKTTFNAASLIPVYLDEALPGDTFNLKMSGFARLSTPLHPIMDNLWLDTFFFAVPYRLVWENWEKFNGAQDAPTDTTSYVIPQQTVPSAGYITGRLQDYFGIPVDVASSVTAWTHSCLPTRAYYLIWNEWFRDQNIQVSVNGGGGAGTVGIGDGPDSLTAGGSYCMRRGKRHDYFTSCLPWPQKGDAVDLPLGTWAPVVSEGTAQPSFEGSLGAGESFLTATAAGSSPTTDIAKSGGNDWQTGEILEWSDTALQADMTSVTGATINALREAFQVQKLLERDARGGTRYTEIIKSHFGVTSPDARLQRPEYLGGGTAPIVVSPVAQTSMTDGALEGGGTATAMGSLAAIGTGSFSGHGFVKSFTEHCLLIGMISARADLTYQSGLDRMWTRSTRYDFFWPAFAGLGEQNVLNQEIFLQDTSADVATFGYQERYAEYRYKPSTITGLFRSVVSGSLDTWHLSQEFTVLPTLSNEFIFEDPDVDRILAVPSEPDFIFDSWFDLKCARPMPMYGVPGMIDHF